MIKHDDNAYATMLLCCQIDPRKDELERPLSPEEWFSLRERAQKANHSLGQLLGLDVSSFELKMGIPEKEAYRYRVLMDRSLPLSYLLETLAGRGIEMITYEERAYPARLRRRLGAKAPPLLYLAGRHEPFLQNAVAILGQFPARGDAEEKLRSLVGMLVARDYVIVTDGGTGLGRLAQDECEKRHGRSLELSRGALSERIAQEDMARLIKNRLGLSLSMFHPDAPCTLAHAFQQNACVYGLSIAAIVMGADEGRGVVWEGATEAMRRNYCSFVYAWDTPLYPGNRPLIEKGAIPLRLINEEETESLSRSWLATTAEQLSFFDRKESWER